MLIRMLLAATALAGAAQAQAQDPAMRGMDMAPRSPPAPAVKARQTGKPASSRARPPASPAASAAPDHGPMRAAADQEAIDRRGTEHQAVDQAIPDPAAMGHGVMDPAPMDPAPMDHATMDHAAMAPGAMDPATIGHATMPAMNHAGMTMGAMTGALGAYSMMRDASGTAWQPDSAPMAAILGMLGSWSTMVHGYATLVYDDQGGPRGADKTFVASMLMGMAQRPIGDGTLTLRAMGSLDPLMGKTGYPLLLATGETADGRTELVDRQHPHDAFMELAAAYSHPLGGALSGFVYLGLPGEPALGPATYMHRFSGLANPEAPITHHWLDSTHVTFGVATAGLVYRGLKLEGSLFTGREPDEHRWNIERPRMDSWSVRATVNPTANLSAQLSHGVLHSPEQLQPQENVRRTTASLTWNLPLGQDRAWQSTFAWGRNAPSGSGHGQVSDGFLLDSAMQLGRWTLFGRAENVSKDELFGDGADGDPLAGTLFTVTKLSLGGYRSVPFGRLALDLGGLVSRYGLPRAIRPIYGANPTCFMLFTRLRIAG